MQRLEGTAAPLGYRWKCSTQKLYLGLREPTCYVHFNLGVYPGQFVVTPTAWVVFREVEFVAARTDGKSVAEARRAAKDGATIGRSLCPLGGWGSFMPGFSDVIPTVREALVATAAPFFDLCASVEGAERLYDEAMRAPTPSIVFNTHHSPSRHLAMLYLLRDRSQFEASVAGWSARGEQYCPETKRVAAFLRDRWDLDLERE